MRIGMMSDNYKTHISGVTNTISLNKRFLEMAGHEVFIFTFDRVGSAPEEKNVIYTSGIPITDFYINFQYNQRAKELLATMDVVHTHHPFVSGYLAKRYCQPINIPIVFTNHSRYDLLAEAYLPLLPSSIIEAGLKAYLSNFFEICDLVILPSPSMHRVLEEYLDPNTPVEIIPHGLDLSVYQAGIQPIARQDLGFSESDIICIYVGRLSPEKNLSFLLYAFHDVVEINPDARLLLVGDGPVRDNLETQINQLEIESKVVFTSSVPYEDVPRYFLASDICVNPSFAESFGLSTVEAMASGLPVLGIDAPGTRDLIKQGVNGLISKNHLSDYTEKLKLLCFDVTLRKTLGDHAAAASRKYDIRTTTDLLIHNYQRVVEAAKQRHRFGERLRHNHGS